MNKRAKDEKIDHQGQSLYPPSLHGDESGKWQQSMNLVSGRTNKPSTLIQYIIYQ